LIAACSRPETLGPGLRRSERRFDREILLQFPDEAEREVFEGSGPQKDGQQESQPKIWENRLVNLSLRIEML